MQSGLSKPRWFAPVFFGVWVSGVAIADEPARPRAVRPADPGQRLERTCFQTGAPWDAMLQLRADVAICYGIDSSLAQRTAQWKAQGYIPHLMTGVAWGRYQDYLYGKFDGKQHVDEAQTDRSGRKISHGGDVYYMSPSESYGKFLCQGVKRAMDAGAEAIHLEEPEFWARGGYSAGFQREWKSFYHEDWVPPHSSPDAQYRASLLKYRLYGRALQQIFDFVKAENARTGSHVKCYVPTHSLINYAHWKIVSPESSLVRVGADGYIAQVWTGTARTPNVYSGDRRERAFETAFLEYGAMMNIVRATSATVWFLNDPIEDNPDHSWKDYRTNWESTLTASLLWPQVWRYEVMPWPERVFHGRYPTVDRANRKPGERVVREPIPAAYATELLIVNNALNDMDQKDVAWDCGTQQIGVVVSDTMMFQRAGPSPSDPDMGSFYGLALPLVEQGIPAEPVQLENATLPGALKPYKVLFLTYEGMKPITAGVHSALAAWVKAGGILIFVDDDSDPYNSVESWWNDKSKGMFHDAPRAHLFAQLGLAKDVPAGTHTIGKGLLMYDKRSPAALSRQKDGATEILALVAAACERAAISYRETNYFALRRGPYLIAAGLAESRAPDIKTLTGSFVNLFDPDLPILDTAALAPGSRYLLIDLGRINRTKPVILAAACKTLDTKVTADGSLVCHAEGPDRVEAVVRIALPHEPAEVTIDEHPLPAAARTWHAGSKTVLLRFPNSAQGRRLTVR
jgi:hypothetical protein